MGLTKQGQPPLPLPSPAHRSAQVPYPANVFHPDNRGGAQVQVASSHTIAPPMSPQPAQVAAPAPRSSDHHPVARPSSRVSLRPLQHVLSVQTDFPELFMPKPSPPSVGGKKMMAVSSPKVQKLKSLPLQFSCGKSFVPKELPPKTHSEAQLLESVRSKFREALAVALSMDSDQQSAGNVSPLGSAGVNRQADGGRMQGITTVFQDAGKDGYDNVTEVAASRSEHGNMLFCNLRADMRTEVGDAMQQQTEHFPLWTKASGNSSVASDDVLQDHGVCWSPVTLVEPSESMPQPNPKRARISDVYAGINVSQIGPESKRAITTDEAAVGKVRIHEGQSVAFRIEEELFKLFGGVNKKYKEKGRSLLFNLKDKNNPVLRERVLSGDITPECLCAMTIEELASKELSEWRMAKAEELANMVVLPDREVDVRRLVRKTHKGEFQVEVDETDVIEVGLGGGSLSNVPSKPVAVETKSVDTTSVHNEVKESDNSAQDGVAETCNSNTSSIFEYPANEKSDLMQEPKPMIDDLQVRENLPQIMSLDELMQILHSEPHSEDQSAGALQNDPSIDKADKALKSESFTIAKDKAAALKFSDLRSPHNFESKLDSPINKSVSILDPVVEPKGDVIVKYPPEKVDAEKPDTLNGSIPESTMQCKIAPDAALTHDHIWEGTIQLSLTSRTNIVAIFKSGEKPSTNKWCRFLEIKGRMRLSVLKEFLEQLSNSRSRAIMVTELCLKKGSLKSGWHHLLEIINSYIADGKVGLVKPAEGVELYLCPQGKAAQILADHLPKEHSGSLTMTETSIIGLAVWRRPHVKPRVPNRQDVPKSLPTISSSILPGISQPPSRSSNACRSHQDVVTADVLPGFGPGVVKDDDDDDLPSSVLPRISQPPSRSSNAGRSHQDVVAADVLPGFGPGVVKGDDDLAEYNFVSASNSSANVTSQTYRSHQHTSLLEDRVREIVRKYGGDRPVAAQPWNGDSDVFPWMVHKYDNMPEWNPNSQSYLQQAQIPQPQFPYQQQLQYHSMLQYQMSREYQSPLPWAYAQHRHTAMPVQQPLTYGLMQPAQQSYYGVPDDSEQFYFAARHAAGIQGLAWNPR